MTLAQDLPPHCSTPPDSSASAPPTRIWAPGRCVWCGGDDSIETFKGEHRCGECRRLEAAITQARSFIGMYGLRPLGGSLDSEDEEERDHRVAARDARAALNARRLAEPPTREQARRAMSGSRSSAVERVESIIRGDEYVPEAPDASDGTETTAPSRTPATQSRHGAGSAGGHAAEESPGREEPRAPRTGAAQSRRRAQSRRTPASSPATDLDIEAMESRVAGLLDKLTAIDSQISDASAGGGLAARARIKDLERQRATVMHTLAALEKARRHRSG